MSVTQCVHAQHYALPQKVLPYSMYCTPAGHGMYPELLGEVQLFHYKCGRKRYYEHGRGTGCTYSIQSTVMVFLERDHSGTIPYFSEVDYSINGKTRE